MKTVQDWGFISKEQGLVKPKLQDNKIFHALTTAYENNQQQEIYGATENIVRREKELCEMAIAELKKLSGGKGDQDGTLKLVMDHYHNRLEMAREKEEKISKISDDSRKMMEEYKKRTQELAEVKRNLMESQSKLRELAKNTEKLLKKEEELRFIETNLRTELDKNKRNIINGLYEIVTDVSDQEPSIRLPEEPIQLNNEKPESTTPTLPVAAPAPRPELVVTRDPEPSHPPLKQEKQVPPIVETISPPRLFTEGLFRRAELPPEKPSPALSVAAIEENIWTRDQRMGEATIPFSTPISPPSQNLWMSKDNNLVEKAGRLKMFEPGKSMVSKSMVKNQEGEVISEYFYSPLHPKEGRHYIFNSLYAVWSLLSLKERDEEAFQERVETVFTDLISRLDHSQNIHLESFLSEEINKDIMVKFLAKPFETRPREFEALAVKILNRIESVGPGRAGLIDNQFQRLPKPDFPPRPGLTA
jgi:hypothetical protein